MTLTQKILAFVSLLVVGLLVTTLLSTTIQAERLADENMRGGLADTKGVWEAFQADRYNKLKLAVRAIGNDPGFKALVEEGGNTGDEGTVADWLKERGADISADLLVCTDPAGVVIARSDRLGAKGANLSSDPVVAKALEGEESATIWRQDTRLFHAASSPIVTGGDLKGVLVAGYAIDEALASEIRKLTRSEVAFLTMVDGRPSLSVSTLSGREEPFRQALETKVVALDASAPFAVDLQGERHVGLAMPLKTGAGDTVGSVVVLRSLSSEMAPFRRFRRSLIAVSLVALAAGLAAAYVATRRITNPVRELASLVARVRDGSFTGAVQVASHDEIGALARAFNGLLADLREKEETIAFLKEGITAARRQAAAVSSDSGSSVTASQAVTASGPVSAVATGSLFASRFEILEALGRGGMGVVYKARDRQLDEIVALKTLRPDVLLTDAALLERFKHELKVARKITHKNVLRTFDFGDSGGTPYISMEYLEGVTLKQLVDSRGALPLVVGLRLAKEMCHGIEAAHDQEVVHRDIKSQNMLILPATGELKVMDFGIARRTDVPVDAGLTAAGMVMGTPDYMSPEQAQGKPADFRSDIYSLGVVFFETFTGRLPFNGGSPIVTITKHIREAPPNPRALNANLPTPLEKIILRCLEKDPSRRYPTVAAILTELDAVSSIEKPAA